MGGAGNDVLIGGWDADKLTGEILLRGVTTLPMRTSITCRSHPTVITAWYKGRGSLRLRRIDLI